MKGNDKLRLQFERDPREEVKVVGGCIAGSNPEAQVALGQLQLAIEHINRGDFSAAGKELGNALASASEGDRSIRVVNEATNIKSERFRNALEDITEARDIMRRERNIPRGFSGVDGKILAAKSSIGAIIATDVVDCLVK